MIVLYKRGYASICFGVISTYTWKRLRNNLSYLFEKHEYVYIYFVKFNFVLE